MRHVFLFYMYLITLSLIFILKVANYMPYQAGEIVAHVAAFFAVSSFIWSFDLPISLYHLQKDKFDAILKARQ